jgi:hypothetical protein
MGEFRRWMKELKDRREKAVRVHVGRGDGKLMRVKKGKRGGAEEDPADEDGNVIEGDADQAADDTTDKGPDEAPESTPEKPTRLDDGGPAANVVIGLALPQWRHTPWAEPMIMVQNYDPLKLSDEAGCDIREWQRQAREWWDEAFAPEPEEALRVARMALDAAVSSDDIREAAEAAPYIVHTCRPTVRHEDEEVDEEELDDDVMSIVKLFEGGKVVRLKPRSPAEDDEIPFEAPDRERRCAELRESLARSEARWAEWRASTPASNCRIAA